MNSKDIKSKKELHIKMLKGAIRLKETVVATMGAYGKNVIIEETNGFCSPTKDGVSVAKAIKFDDKYENMGARFIIDSAISTVEDVGDGTTTTILLASCIYETAIKNYVERRWWHLRKKNFNHRAIIEQINSDMEKALKLIDGFKKDVTSVEELINVATISANNDKKIGELVGKLWYDIGKEGIIYPSRSENGTTYSKSYDGLSIGSGYYTKLFSNKGSKSILNNTHVLITNHDITSANDIMPILQFIADDKNNKIFIMANSFSNDVIGSLLKNKQDGTFDVCVVETPKMGNWTGIDEDMAMMLGATFIDQKEELKLDELDESKLGFAKEITSTINKTTVIPKKKAANYDAHIKDLQSDVEERQTETYKARLKERIARIEGKIVTIYIGGETETEHGYLYDMFDDSVKATKHCLDSGITIGGGSVYAKISNELGDSILGEVLTKPLEQLLINSGYNNKYIRSKINEVSHSDNSLGFNLLSDTYGLENLYDSGVIEPIGLIKNCIKNSCSVANLLISTHSGVAIIPESLI